MSEFCNIPALEHSQFSVNFDFSSSAICHKRQASHDDDRYKDTDWDDDDFESNHDRGTDRSLNSQPESSKRARMDDNDQNSWTEMFDMLIHFGIQHSHCNVPFNHVIKIGDGTMLIPLGAWLSRQLELERSHSLLPERRQKLQILVDNHKLLWLNDRNDIVIHDIAPTLSSADMEWNERFESLLNFGDEFGHCNVPIKREYPLPSGPIIELGAWLEEQRKALRGRTLDRAKSDRFDTLVEAGKLNWRFNGFTITHSDSSITSQLAAASASSSSSSPSAGLAAASSSFSSSSSATEIRGTWILAFEALIRYGEEHGTCNVPIGVDCVLSDGTEHRLGKWIDRQRQKQREKTLSPEREALLQTLVEDGRLKWRLWGTAAQDDGKWMEMFQTLLTNGKNKDGTYNVRKTLKVKNITSSGECQVLLLGAWLHAQREEKQRGRLRVDRENMLQGLVDQDLLSWQPIRSVRTRDDGRWCVFFEALVRYGEENGNCNVPQYTEYPQSDGALCNLGFWVNKQRKDRRSGSLLPDREDRLESLVRGGLFKWNMHFSAAAEGQDTSGVTVAVAQQSLPPSVRPHPSSDPSFNPSSYPIVNPTVSPPPAAGTGSGINGPGPYSISGNYSIGA